MWLIEIRYSSQRGSISALDRRRRKGCENCDKIPYARDPICRRDKSRGPFPWGQLMAITLVPLALSYNDIRVKLVVFALTCQK